MSLKYRYYTWMGISLLIAACYGYHTHRPLSAPPLVISPETTRITSPLYPDGRVNYDAYLKEQYAEIPDAQNLIVQLCRFSPEAVNSLPHGPYTPWETRFAPFEAIPELQPYPNRGKQEFQPSEELHDWYLQNQATAVFVDSLLAREDWQAVPIHAIHQQAPFPVLVEPLLGSLSVVAALQACHVEQAFREQDTAAGVARLKNLRKMVHLLRQAGCLPADMLADISVIYQTQLLAGLFADEAPDPQTLAAISLELEAIGTMVSMRPSIERQRLIELNDCLAILHTKQTESTRSHNNAYVFQPDANAILKVINTFIDEFTEGTIGVAETQAADSEPKVGAFFDSVEALNPGRSPSTFFSSARKKQAYEEEISRFRPLRRFVFNIGIGIHIRERADKSLNLFRLLQQGYTFTLDHGRPPADFAELAVAQEVHVDPIIDTSTIEFEVTDGVLQVSVPLAKSRIGLSMALPAVPPAE